MSLHNVKTGDLLHLEESHVFASIYDRSWTDAFKDEPGTIGFLSKEEFCFFIRKKRFWSLVMTSKGVKGWIETSKLRKMH